MKYNIHIIIVYYYVFLSLEGPETTRNFCFRYLKMGL